MKELIDRLQNGEELTKAEFTALLAAFEDEGLAAYLAEKSSAARDRVFGRKVFLRGLIEFTNYCRNDCLYCGLRHSNAQVERYRLKPEDILACCRAGHELGFRTFVLQGGEDPGYGQAELLELISVIHQSFPDCAVTLSIGEQSRELYEQYFAAGASRFLLRHESADPDHYRRLHPPSLSPEKRRGCLWTLKDIGFQVGAGFMVGSPWQTPAHLAEDFLFLQKLSPHMVGLGPFIPHPETPLGHFPAGSVELTLFCLGLTCLMLPKALLPATTALGSLAADGRERALAFGANVLMPNLSPPEVRRKYEIYSGKIHLDEEAAEGVHRLRLRLAALGYETPAERGDYPF